MSGRPARSRGTASTGASRRLRARGPTDSLRRIASGATSPMRPSVVVICARMYSRASSRTGADQAGWSSCTLVGWGGEFGRSVCCQGRFTKQVYGRDHHPTVLHRLDGRRRREVRHHPRRYRRLLAQHRPLSRARLTYQSRGATSGCPTGPERSSEGSWSQWVAAPISLLHNRS